MSLFAARENPLAPALAEARRSIDMLSETVRLLREQNADLLERYHALKVAGAVSVPPPVEPMPSGPRPEPDELKALIYEKSGDNLRMRKMMLRQLQADRAAGVSPEKIQQAIEHGVSSDGVPV